MTRRGFQKRSNRITVFFALLFLAVPLVPAFSDFWSDTEFIPDVRFWGGGLELRYKGWSLAEPLVTRLCILGAAGYEDPAYFRESNGSRYTPPTDASTNLAVYKRMEAVWGLGIKQGILFDERKNDNLLEAHLLYRGRYDNHVESASIANSLVFDSGLPDANGILQNSLVTGLFANTVVIHETQRKRNGISADASVEYAPEFLANNVYGKADFTRLTFDFRSYLTIADFTPEDAQNENLFNIYLGNRIVFDTLFGSAIPINARQSIGGRNIAVASALGYSVRGIDSRRFDSFMKLIVNTDLRMNIGYVAGFVPGTVFYFDAGLCDDLDYNLSLSNLKYSTGAGVFVYIFGFEPTLYFNYFVNEGRFSLAFDFTLHF